MKGKIKASGTSNEDDAIKTALNALESWVSSIKYFKRVLGVHQKFVIILIDIKSDTKLIGEIAYPNIGSIVPPLIELVPQIMPKLIDHTHNLSVLLFDSLIFLYFRKFNK